MAKEFGLSVVAPDRSVAEENVISIMAPGEVGYFGVMAGHTPTIFALKPGLVEYQKPNGERHYISVSGGFAEVSTSKVIILADAAEKATEIDIQRAQESLDRARKALRGEDSTMSTEEAAQAIERASARLRAAKQ